MADPEGDGGATPPEPTPQDQPETGNGDELTAEQRNAVAAAEHPDAVREIISAASRRARQAEAEAKAARSELQGLQDQGKSELEKANGRAERAEARAAKLERTLLISSVATRHRLDPELASRLRGETEEELEADAKALAKRFPGHQEQPPPDLGGGARDSATPAGSQGFSDRIRRQAQARR
jgi:hypothetical protein